MKDFEETLQLDYGQIYIEVRSGIVTLEFDGGDGLSRLSIEQMKKLKEILNISTELK